MADSYPNKADPDRFIPHGLVHTLDDYDPVIIPATKGCWSISSHYTYCWREMGYISVIRSKSIAQGPPRSISSSSLRGVTVIIFFLLARVARGRAPFFQVQVALSVSAHTLYGVDTSASDHL